MKNSGYLFILLMFGAIHGIFAQENTLNTHVLDQRQRYLNVLRQQSAPLYEMEQQLQELEKEIQSAVQKFQRKDLSRDEAREQIRPLLEKQLAIRQSKEFQLEHMIMGLLSQQQGFSQQGPVSSAK